MSLIRAMRLINALEAGTLSGPDFVNLIAADPARAAELSVIYGMRGQVRRLIATNGVFAKLLGSAQAVKLLVTNRVAMQEIRNMPTAWAALQADSAALAKYLAVLAGLDPAAYNTAAAVVTASASSVAALNGILSAGLGENPLLSVVKSAAAMATVDASATLRPLVYGEPLEGGYFGCINTVSATRYAVIMAPKSIGEYNGTVVWKTTADASAGTDGMDDGLANANAQNNASHPLFQWARGLSIGGKTDWAPPAQNVIQAIAAKLRPAIAGNLRFITGSEEAYEATIYWSATQHPSNTNNAWSVNFSAGAVANYAKVNTYRARAVRRIIL